MHDDDLRVLKAYLDTLCPVNRPSPEHDLRAIVEYLKSLPPIATK